MFQNQAKQRIAMIWTSLLFIMPMATFFRLDAQDNSCPLLVQQALESTGANCAEVGRNQACYGNAQIELLPQVDSSGTTFNEGGDIVDVVAIQSLQLSPLITPNEWGVAVLSVQANLPDTLPGQNVTLLLFGDVEINNEGTSQPLMLDVMVSGAMNLRGGPGTTFAILGSLSAGDVVVADGRNEAGDWVHVQLSDEAGTGWLYVPLIAVEGEVTELDVVEVSEEADSDGGYAPMQAFTFSSGVGSVGCEEAPQDGMLIQTPQGVGTIDLLINGIEVSLGSTAFLHKPEEDMLAIAMLEGQATLRTEEGSSFVPAGGQATIPLNEESQADGSPMVAPLDMDNPGNLPLSLLPRDIVISEPLTEAEIENLVFGGIEGGLWDYSLDGVELEFECNTSSYSKSVTRNGGYPLFISDDGLTAEGRVMTPLGNGMFIGEWQDTTPGCDGGICTTDNYTLNLTVLSPTEVVGNMSIISNVEFIAGGVCTLNYDFTLTQSG